MIQESEQLVKVLQKFPDQNPNPVLRFSDKGVLQYYNSPSEPIIDAWKININDENYYPFSLEKQLEDFIVNNWGRTQFGAKYDIYE